MHLSNFTSYNSEFDAERVQTFYEGLDQARNEYLCQIVEISEPINIKQRKNEVAIGIDFGTTNSLICVCTNGDAKIIPNIDGDELTASIAQYESIAISSVKRLLGKSKDELLNSPALLSVVGNLLDYSSQKLVLNINGRILTPIEIAAQIFTKLKHSAENYLKTKIKKAVVTMPSYFDDAAKGSLILAARLAGIEVLRLLAEPTAAAYAYGINKKVTGNYLVYDLGGGTFDVSLLSIEKGVIRVIALGGDNLLGGDDIDLAVKDFLQKKYNLQIKEPELLELAKKIKHHLSHAEKFIDQDIEIDRTTFEEIIKQIIDRTIKITQEIWDDSVEAIILVGGSTRIPIISKLLYENFNCKILSDLDPDKIVAQGAGLQAENLTCSKNMLLIDAVPLSLGLELYGGLVEKIIERNSPLPISITKQYTTYADNQDYINFHIVQGEREFAKDCRSLAYFELGPLEPTKAGSIKIEVSFVLDADGILSVSAFDTGASKSHEIQIKPSFGLDQDEIDKILVNAYENAINDHKNMVLKERILKAETFIKNFKNILQIMENDLSPKEGADIQEAIDALQKGIKIKDVILLDQCMETLNKLSEEILNDKLQLKVEEMIKGHKINEYKS